MIREKDIIMDAERDIYADRDLKVIYMVRILGLLPGRPTWTDDYIRHLKIRDLSNVATHWEELTKHTVSLEDVQLLEGLEWYYALMKCHYEKDVIPAAGSAEYEWQKSVGEVLDKVERMLGAFDDLEERLQCHIDLIGQLKELFQLAGSMGGRDREEAVLLLHDALYGIYSEELTRRQLRIVEQAVESLRGVEWDREKVRRLHRELRKCGFETVPSDRFEKLYDARGVGKREATIP